MRAVVWRNTQRMPTATDGVAPVVLNTRKKADANGKDYACGADRTHAIAGMRSCNSRENQNSDKPGGRHGGPRSRHQHREEEHGPCCEPRPPPFAILESHSEGEKRHHREIRACRIHIRDMTAPSAAREEVQYRGLRLACLREIASRGHESQHRRCDGSNNKHDDETTCEVSRCSGIASGKNQQRHPFEQQHRAEATCRSR